MKQGENIIEKGRHLHIILLTKKDEYRGLEKELEEKDNDFVHRTYDTSTST